MNKIEQLKKEIEELEKKERLDKERANIPFAQLAEIGQSLKVSEEARLKYEELFKDFVDNKLSILYKEMNIRRKKFIFKIGFE